jgi:predicted alpha/beta-fold hydrolase
MTVTNQFKPAWWLRNTHLQTIWPALCRPNIKNLNLKRERVELPDGDFIDLDWAPCESNGPIILILHGLEGSIDSHYAKSLLKQFCNRGWRGGFMHFRGCSGEPNRLARGYHSGETGDVEFIVRKLREREPNVKMAVVGISLGGNVLLKWLGETADQNNFLDAAIAVSVPFELHKAAARIQIGFSRFYQWYFMKCLRERLIEKFQVTISPVNPAVLHEVRSMFEFDDKVTAPLHGFDGVDDYYTTSSSRQYLRNIKVPTLIMHAKDDPFMTEDVIPEPHELSPNVLLEVTDHGGHVGFVGGKYPWRPEYWMDQRIPDFLKEYFG